MNEVNKEKKEESQFYPVIKSKLENLFREKYKDRTHELHLEITANSKFGNKLKSKISSGKDIIFTFLKSASPDITGFIDIKDDYSNSGFIVLEFKKDEIKLDDIYQARKYGELLEARYAFLVSLHQIPEELRRLSKTVYALLSLPAYRTLTLVSFDEGNNIFLEWYPENPFVKK